MFKDSVSYDVHAHKNRVAKSSRYIYVLYLYVGRQVYYDQAHSFVRTRIILPCMDILVHTQSWHTVSKRLMK
jgi:hypothetical protein